MSLAGKIATLGTSSDPSELLDALSMLTRVVVGEEEGPEGVELEGPKAASASLCESLRAESNAGIGALSSLLSSAHAAVASSALLLVEKIASAPVDAQCASLTHEALRQAGATERIANFLWSTEASDRLYASAALMMLATTEADVARLSRVGAIARLMELTDPAHVDYTPALEASANGCLTNIRELQRLNMQMEPVRARAIIDFSAPSSAYLSFGFGELLLLHLDTGGDDAAVLKATLPARGLSGLVPASGAVAMEGPLARVVTDFVAEQEGELTAHAGDRVTLLFRPEGSVPEGWVLACFTDRAVLPAAVEASIGFLPRSYVVELDEGVGDAGGDVGGDAGWVAEEAEEVEAEEEVEEALVADESPELSALRAGLEARATATTEFHVKTPQPWHNAENRAVFEEAESVAAAGAAAREAMQARARAREEREAKALADKAEARSRSLERARSRAQEAEAREQKMRMARGSPGHGQGPSTALSGGEYGGDQADLPVSPRTSGLFEQEIRRQQGLLGRIRQRKVGGGQRAEAHTAAAADFYTPTLPKLKPSASESALGQPGCASKPSANSSGRLRGGTQSHAALPPRRHDGSPPSTSPRAMRLPKTPEFDAAAGKAYRMVVGAASKGKERKGANDAGDAEAAESKPLNRPHAHHRDPYLHVRGHTPGHSRSVPRRSPQQKSTPQHAQSRRSPNSVGRSVISLARAEALLVGRWEVSPIYPNSNRRNRPTSRLAKSRLVALDSIEHETNVELECGGAPPPSLAKPSKLERSPPPVAPPRAPPGGVSADGPGPSSSLALLSHKRSALANPRGAPAARSAPKAKQMSIMALGGAVTPAAASSSSFSFSGEQQRKLPSLASLGIGGGGGKPRFEQLLTKDALEMIRRPPIKPARPSAPFSNLHDRVVADRLKEMKETCAVPGGILWQWRSKPPEKTKEDDTPERAEALQTMVSKWLKKKGLVAGAGSS
jgi:hypothetical protein